MCKQATCAPLEQVFKYLMPLLFAQNGKSKKKNDQYETSLKFYFIYVNKIS